MFLHDIKASALMEEEVAKLSEQELREQLLTTDYRGKEWKEHCLNELLKRAGLM